MADFCIDYNFVIDGLIEIDCQHRPIGQCNIIWIFALKLSVMQIELYCVLYNKIYSSREISIFASGLTGKYETQLSIQSHPKIFKIGSFSFMLTIMSSIFNGIIHKLRFTVVNCEWLLSKPQSMRKENIVKTEQPNEILYARYSCLTCTGIECLMFSFRARFYWNKQNWLQFMNWTVSLDIGDLVLIVSSVANVCVWFDIQLLT